MDISLVENFRLLNNHGAFAYSTGEIYTVKYDGRCFSKEGF